MKQKVDAAITGAAAWGGPFFACVYAYPSKHRGGRRSAALALAISGSRAQAIAMKEYLPTGSSLCRTAMLLATSKLGADERRYLRRRLGLSDPFERLCAETELC